jgi:hypothetical protein
MGRGFASCTIANDMLPVPLVGLVVNHVHDDWLVQAQVDKLVINGIVGLLALLPTVNCPWGKL